MGGEGGGGREGVPYVLPSSRGFMEKRHFRQETHSTCKKEERRILVLIGFSASTKRKGEGKRKGTSIALPLPLGKSEAGKKPIFLFVSKKGEAMSTRSEGDQRRGEVDPYRIAMFSVGEKKRKEK